MRDDTFGMGRAIAWSLAVLMPTTVLLAASLIRLNVKTGLWQVTMTTTIDELPLSHTNTYSACLKQEDLSHYPFTDPDAHCVWNVVTSTSSQMRATGTCTPAGLGTLQFNMNLVAIDPATVKATGQLATDSPAGALHGSYTGAAKWLGATCPAGMR